MTTYYKEVPTLEMRVAAAPLVVTGTVGRPVATTVEHYDGEAFVRTTYEVMVTDVLKGSGVPGTILVEVTGGEAGRYATPQAAPLREGVSLALVLGARSGQEAYVPYFGSAYPLEDDGTILLGPEAPATLASERLRIEGQRIRLDDLRGLVGRVTAARAAAAEAAASAGSGEADRRPPPVTEMPLGVEGGGQPGAPETLDRER
ncbi:hypothetical protein [Actinophytocola xanthii]|uniref:Uncharacterized protein n=1 Tax=Actinophytocola xanthii TaxID=1912961 RepID=A0A1Q8CNT2_9PSEU|nr:hypothetical protein [Actinophytocola xanthii]OLF15976.1 hypothetical protein BU204_18925 [Actinophytocola xanthii]